MLTPSGTTVAPARFAVHHAPPIERLGQLPAVIGAIEAEFPGWHVFMSDAGHPWAVKATHGGGVTLDAPGIGMMPHIIAVWEHAHALEVLRGGVL